MPVRLRAVFRGDLPAPHAEPVTVTVARLVRPERREEFERWADDVLGVAAAFPGNLGATLLHPGPDSSEYHLVYRFVDDTSLAAWERSSERRTALAHVEEMVDDERVSRAVGLESFFAVPPRPGPAWRSWLLTVAVVLVFTSAFQLIAVPFVGDWPWPLRLLLSAVYVVTALRLLMPRLSRWLGPRLQRVPPAVKAQ
ncbi:antibiotic biosynthesis monooxygenase [Blastococcus atacamensis]|uniref:antibiotic biosynthesis monooxygenase n=1 Tax=Blastococcus atacamensis TaxID=2070508 RepID=UPI000CECC263|nr:antibiotic biosynthesis monooxygenase [Blastococcus atacamensis]